MRAILTFHSIDSSGSVMSIPAEDLRCLIHAIRAGGHTIVDLHSLLTEPSEQDRIAVTFDDGLRSVHREALPILREENVPATLLLTTGHVGADSRWASLPADGPVFPMLTWAEIEDLQAAGWDIQAHTVSHPHLSRLAEGEIETEFVASNDTIASRLERTPSVLAYPYGTVDYRTAEIAARHYEFCLTTQMALLPETILRPQHVPRLDVYYFRSPHIHRHFGALSFRAYLALRGVLRKLRGQ